MAQKADRVVAVAVTDSASWWRRALLLCACLTASTPLLSTAAVLPEDRSDAMYHGYDGGGLQVEGPSVLVRKGFKDKDLVCVENSLGKRIQGPVKLVQGLHPEHVCIAGCHGHPQIN